MNNRTVISSTTRSANSSSARSGSDLPASMLAFCRCRAVFRAGESVVAAVSGGPDSLCLLHCLHERSTELGITLHVAHVHHGLRGSEADADAAFVEQEAHTLGLPCTVLRADARAYAARKRVSLETAARETRYAALRALAADLGADCLAIGHTEDDQAETVLLHLLRGSGLDGLAAMRPRRGDLARPLLGLSRSAVTAFCRDRGLTARSDRTNSDPRFRRNAVRMELLPVLKHFNPRACAALARCAATLAADADYLREQAIAALDTVLESGTADGVVALKLGLLTALPPAMRSRVLRLAVERLRGAGAALSAERLDDLEMLIRQHRVGRGLDIGRGCRAERTPDLLILGAARPPAEPLDPVRLPIPGSIVFG
ncbi:MAG: tRNA lysidine(34) synthetase TilS, partial [Chloroflexota bacterium]